MNELPSYILDFESEYIQEYATQFDVMLGANFLRTNYPNILNNYSHMKKLFFFPSNRNQKKQIQIKEKYMQFSNNHVFFLLKVAIDNTPLNFDFIEAKLINYQNTDIFVDINTVPPNLLNYNSYNTHVNKKNGQQLTRQKVICHHASDRFQSIFKIKLQHICDIRLNY